MAETSIRSSSKLQWRDWQPQLDGMNATLGIVPGGTPPVHSPASLFGSASGTYLYDRRSGMVDCQFSLSIGSSGSVGNCIYVVKLPIPARKRFGGEYAGTWGSSGPNAADRQLGMGQLLQGAGTEEPNLLCQWVTADGIGLTYGGRKEDYAQAFCPYMRLKGSGNIGTGQTTALVQWGTGTAITFTNVSGSGATVTVSTTTPPAVGTYFTVGGAFGGMTGIVNSTYQVATVSAGVSFTFTNLGSVTGTYTSGGTITPGLALQNVSNGNAADIIIMSTNGAYISGSRQYFITNITSTGFTVNTDATQTGTAQTFDWKYIGDTSLLVAYNAPWGWGIGDYMRGYLRYEADT